MCVVLIFLAAWYMPWVVAGKYVDPFCRRATGRNEQCRQRIPTWPRVIGLFRPRVCVVTSSFVAWKASIWCRSNTWWLLTFKASSGRAKVHGSVIGIPAEVSDPPLKLCASIPGLGPEINDDNKRSWQSGSPMNMGTPFGNNWWLGKICFVGVKKENSCREAWIGAAIRCHWPLLRINTSDGLRKS